MAPPSLHYQTNRSLHPACHHTPTESGQGCHSRVGTAYSPGPSLSVFDNFFPLLEHRKKPYRLVRPRKIRKLQTYSIGF